MSAFWTPRSSRTARNRGPDFRVEQAHGWYPQDRSSLVNRFFRSALFPLIIIAALVWLALQTLGSHGTKVDKQTTSWVYQQVRDTPSSIDNISIDPNKQSLTLTQTDGKKYSV